MAFDDFASCYANKVSADVDKVKEVGEENWKKFADWWHGLSDISKAVILAIAAYGGAKIAALIGAAVGDVVAGALILFAGGASWEILIQSAVECSDQM
jgi:NaMN:DMB phosphoribosyltransferase